MILIARILALFIAIPIHEFAHGFVSYKLGDPTAKYQGRLSLNPLKHIDPMGAVLIVLTGFGWAKPVNVDSRYYKKPQDGIALTALAGPASNLLLAFVLMVISKVFIVVSLSTGFSNTGIFNNINFILSVIINVNISLAVFNMLPIPTFDGFNVFRRFMSHELVYKVQVYQQQIMFVLFFLLAFTSFLSLPLGMLNNMIFQFMDTITSFIY